MPGGASDVGLVGLTEAAVRAAEVQFHYPGRAVESPVALFDRRLANSWLIAVRGDAADALVRQPHALAVGASRTALQSAARALSRARRATSVERVRYSCSAALRCAMRGSSSSCRAVN
jgi:hypothetical protein